MIKKLGQKDLMRQILKVNQISKINMEKFESHNSKSKITFIELWKINLVFKPTK